MGAQAVLHRLADTDLPAQLAYQDAITAFHGRIREFYYGYMFNDRPFDTADFARRRVFEPRQAGQDAPWSMVLAVLLVAALVAGAGWLRTGRIAAGQGSSGT